VGRRVSATVERNSVEEQLVFSKKRMASPQVFVGQIYPSAFR